MRLLLDSHLPPALAAALRRHAVDIEHLSEWREGSYREAGDHEILLAAAEDHRVLVTSDRGTIPELLIRMWQSDEHHRGVLFVDEEQFPSADIGRLERGLLSAVAEAGDWDWANRISTLRIVERDV